MKIKEMLDSEKISALTSSKKVVLDFYAEWCNPCKEISKVLDSLKTETKLSDIDVIKINVDNNQSTTNIFEVRSLPTLTFLIKKESGDYEIVNKQVGFVNKASFVKLVEASYER